MPSYFHKNCLQWEFCTLKTNFSHLFFPVDLTWKRETIGKDLIFPVFEKWKRKTRRPYFLKTFVQLPSYFPKNRLLWKFCALKTYDGHHLFATRYIECIANVHHLLVVPKYDTKSIKCDIWSFRYEYIRYKYVFKYTNTTKSNTNTIFFWYMEFICSWYTSVHPKHQLENDFRWSWV